MYYMPKMPLKTFTCDACGCDLSNYDYYYRYDEEVLCDGCMDERLEEIKNDAEVTPEDSYGKYIDITCDI